MIYTIYPYHVSLYPLWGCYAIIEFRANVKMLRFKYFAGFSYQIKRNEIV